MPCSVITGLQHGLNARLFDSFKPAFVWGWDKEVTYVQ